MCCKLQLNEYFSPKFTQDDPLWTINRSLVQGVSKFNTFLKWTLGKFFDKIQKLEFFKLWWSSSIYTGFLSFKPFCKIRGAKNGYKNRFQGRASSKHIRFQISVGASNKDISVHFFILWDDQGWQNRVLKMSVFVN